jgi:hypothetical protein
MNRRTLAILLIILGAAAVIGILIWTFYPVYQQRVAQQPPPITNTVPAPQFTAPQITGDQPIPVPVFRPAATSTNPNGPEEQERQAQDALRRRSLDLVSRLGSYASSDQFESMKATYVDLTPAAKTYIESVRQSLVKTYPQTMSWGRTTKAVAAVITDGFPIRNANNTKVTVQSQVITNQGDVATVTYTESFLEFEKQNNIWMLSKVTSTAWGQ